MPDPAPADPAVPSSETPPAAGAEAAAARTTPPGPLKSLAFTIVFLLALGLLVEGAARLFGGQTSNAARSVMDIERNYRTSEESMFVFDRNLLYRPKPHYESDYKYVVNMNPFVTLPETYHVTLNEYGFRGPPLDDPKQRFRIFCLGDSVTFGLNAPDDYTYPAIMQDQLDRAKPGAVEVVNAGVPSYSSDYGVFWLQDVILPLQPDFVILAYGHNDWWMNPRELRIFMAGHGQADWRVSLQRVLNRSAAYRVYKRMVLAVRDRNRPESDEDPTKATKTYHNYERMLDMLRERRIPAMILILYNQRPQIVAQLAQVAKDYQVPLMDFRPLFARLGPERLMSEQKHPNTRGYSVIGAGVADTVAQLIGLPKPPPLGASAAAADPAAAGAVPAPGPDAPGT